MKTLTFITSCRQAAFSFFATAMSFGLLPDKVEPRFDQEHDGYRFTFEAPEPRLDLLCKVARSLGTNAHQCIALTLREAEAGECRAVQGGVS